MHGASGYRHTDLAVCINLGGRCRDGEEQVSLLGSSLVFSLVLPTKTQKMSSKSANILFDDMFTIQDVDRARFERGAFSIRSTFRASGSEFENIDITSFPSSSSFLKLWNGPVFRFPP